MSPDELPLEQDIWDAGYKAAKEESARELAAKGEELARLNALVECMPLKQKELALNALDLHAAIDQRDREFAAQTAAAEGLRAELDACYRGYETIVEILDRDKVTEDELAIISSIAGNVLERRLVNEAKGASPSPWRDVAAREWTAWTFRDNGKLYDRHNATSDASAMAIGWEQVLVRELSPPAPPTPQQSNES